MRGLVIILVLLVSTAAAHAGNVDRLSTYAVLLGRGAACGADIDAPSTRVGAWIDQTWSGKDRAAMMMAMIQGWKLRPEIRRGGGLRIRAPRSVKRWRKCSGHREES